MRRQDAWRLDGRPSRDIRTVNMLSRRDVVQRGATLIAGGLASRRTWASPAAASTQARLATHAQRVDPAPLLALATRAVDAARTAGATYADARLTRTVAHDIETDYMSVTGGRVTDGERIGVGVRALVNGYWGFAASPIWTADEMVRLARMAVTQAQENARGTSRRVEIGHIPAARGTWTMPGIDPFTIPIEEKLDFLNSWRQSVNELSLAGVSLWLMPSQMSFSRLESVLASTDDIRVSQTRYLSSGNIQFAVKSADLRAQHDYHAIVQGIGLQGRGWEMFLDADIPGQIPQRLVEAAELCWAQRKPVESSRYTVVCDATTVAALVEDTIGAATQLDRALGYEADAAGTSYLGPDPLAFLGTYRVGSPLLTVTGNRTDPGGAATVRWDDDGVEPQAFTLVRDGMLVDYQTTREQAAWLAPYYTRHGLPVQSHGCAASHDAFSVPLQHCPNLTLQPAPTAHAAESFLELVADVQHGIAIQNGYVQTDFQAASGSGGGFFMREIVRGKLGAILDAGEFRFQTTDLWKHLVALGGANSVGRSGAIARKGEPTQSTAHTVTAVPAIIENMPVINYTRRT